MRKLFAPVLVASSLIAAIACVNPPAKSAADATRANARAAVLTAKAAYVLVGNACLDASLIVGNSQIVAKCATYLDPAYKLIVDAANGVDTVWSPVLACELTQATDLVVKAVTDLGPLSASLAPYAQDAALLAHNLLGGVSCAPAADAGVNQ